jgi:hypothetical protein
MRPRVNASGVLGAGWMSQPGSISQPGPRRTAQNAWSNTPSAARDWHLIERRARGRFWLANAPRCGSTDELEFDHIDPETKVFAVGSDMSRAWDKLVEEALKCQLPCRECHVAKGIEDRPEPAHSYYRYWYYGCRCATCKAANARKSARQRERKLMGKVGMIPFPTIPTATKPLVKLPRRDSNTEPAG